MSARQQSLFDAEPAPWELDSAEQRLTATIVLPSGADGEFDYLVPDEFCDDRQPQRRLEAGRRVRVPLGRGDRLVVGYCVGAEVKPVGSRRLKSIVEVIDPQCLLSPSMLRLTRWMAEYYMARWGQVLEAVVPSGVRGRAGTRDVVLLSAPARVAAQMAKLDLPDKQRRALEVLVASPKPLAAKQLAARAECTSAPINALRQKGLIQARTERLDTGELENLLIEREPPKELNNDQRTALAAIHESLDSAEHHTTLIHGVTGSGKTEVYIQAIEKVVSFGRQAIVLVPEISLTPQTVQRFRARFDHVAVLHSHQSDVERHRQWRRIASGEVQVVVGARSAIFAPTRRLGLVIVDEEHETSFKQDSSPRYHARDVAVERTRAEGIPLVLGTATPSLESWRRAGTGEYRLVSMPRRVSNRPLPAVRTVDLRDEVHSRSSRGAIARPLHQAMEAALRDGGQVILLLNRRGFSTHVQCPSCGFALMCPECDVALTFHREDNSALCHWCDYRTRPPAVCPDCKSANIRYSGFGTQKLEAEVRARFPNFTRLRMDADTMRRPGSHERALDSFRRGDVRILLGTQMIAKGLDFPNVTLVGVINADTALHLPDFRAAERTFQLVTQVAGRTGRGDAGGRVLVQTFDPDHPAIRAAVGHDFAAFARGELPLREALGYPPYGALVRIVARGEAEKTVEAFVDEAANQLRALASTTITAPDNAEARALNLADAEAPGSEDPPAIRVLGPAPAPMPKLRGKYRFHLQAQSLDGDRLHAAVAALLKALAPPDGVEWIVDIDPVDML